MPKISIVIPCYFNEGNIIPTTTTLLETEKLFPSDVTFEYVLVDDGSKDGTWNELVKFQHRFPEKVKVLKLARNFGANNASLAGLNHATGDCNVILAADLQDPPELIPKMYEYWRKGIKFVIANRSDREESFRQSFVSNTFHFLMRNFALSNTPKGGYDLTLFDREIRETVVRMDEKNGYLPYLFLWLGYEYVNIPYVRKAREIGVSGMS
jgi:glycosyltransferase involved in cell wall biosynthesis